MARPFRSNRIRYGSGKPAPNALEKGEIAVQIDGGTPKLWVGLGGSGLASFTGAVANAGEVANQQRGGIIYADEQQASGTSVLVLRTPTRLRLSRISAKSGSGTCEISIVAGGHTFPAIAASSTISTLAYSPDEPPIVEGTSIAMTVSNAVDLTSLVVQLDWLEG